MAEQARTAGFEPKVCAVCGRPFRRAAPIAKYCSKRCRATANKAQRAARKHGGPSAVDISPPKEEG